MQELEENYFHLLCKLIPEGHSIEISKPRDYRLEFKVTKHLQDENKIIHFYFTELEGKHILTIMENAMKDLAVDGKKPISNRYITIKKNELLENENRRLKYILESEGGKEDIMKTVKKAVKEILNEYFG